jgi:hypothetical protein
MKPTFSTVQQYLASLPADRREAISSVRKVILKNLGKGYEEGIQYGMIGYYVPHEVYPPGYHCDPKQPLPFAALGSGKGQMSLHLMCLYDGCGGPDGSGEKLLAWFQTAWAATGKKLDMGKACIRFKSADDLALDVIGEVIRKMPASKWIKIMSALRPSRPSRAAASKSASARPVRQSKKSALTKVGK